MLTWTLGATIGVKFSKNFSLNKQAQKVKYVASDVAISDGDTPSGDNTNNSGSTNPTNPTDPDQEGME